MKIRGVYLAVTAALCLGLVLVPGATAAQPLHGKKEIGKEKREEDEREDVTDREIVERERVIEAPIEEEAFQQQREELEREGKPPGEELAPEVELLVFRQSVVSGGTHVKVRVNPHGSYTRVLMYLDWAKKCNSQVTCPTKGKYTHESARLGVVSTRAKDLKGKFKVGECQVGLWVIEAVNRWAVTRDQGWFGDCY